MKPCPLKQGDVVRIAKSDRPEYIGALLVVTEPKLFGAQGYLYLPYEIEGLVRFKGLAYLRVAFDDIEYVGRGVTLLGENNDNDEE